MTTSNAHQPLSPVSRSFLTTALALSLVAMGGLSACCVPTGSDASSSSTQSESSSGATTSSDESKEKETTRKKLENTALTAALPSEAKMKKGFGLDATKIQWDTSKFLTIRRLPGSGTSIEKAKKNKREIYKDIASMNVEKLDDGWILETVTETSLGKLHRLFAQRKVGDDHFVCDAAFSQPEEFEEGIALCKSLKVASKKDSKKGEKEEEKQGEMTGEPKGEKRAEK